MKSAPKPDFEDSNMGGDPDANGMKEGTKAEEAADRAEEMKGMKKPPAPKRKMFSLKGLMVTKRPNKINKANVI